MDGSGGFSRFGQCGRRNAQSTAQRINNPSFQFQEGDAEFGMLNTVLFIKGTIDVIFKELFRWNINPIFLIDSTRYD